MKSGKFTGILFCLIFLIVSPANAESFVWKVTKGDHHLFLGGTVHLLTEADYPLPPAFDLAYKKSVRVVLETDIEKMQSPEFQQTILKAMTYADERTLKQVLKPATYQALEEHFTSRGIPMTTMLKFKPGMMAITLTLVELQRLGLAGIGVDEYFSTKARHDRKELGQLETPEAQLTFLAELGRGQEDQMLTYTLRDINSLPDLMHTIKDAWRRGDTEKLSDVALMPMKNDYPEVYRTLLINRNNAWCPPIETMLETEDVELVLVGALHLVGEDGILARLAERGYNIQQLRDVH